MATALSTAEPLNPPAAALAWVPGCEAGLPPVGIERLTGGTVNQVWRVESARGQFVLRVDGAAWRRPGVDRQRELRLHRCAASAGLAPALRAVSPALDVWVCEYLSGRDWTPADYADAGQLQRLGERLAALHRLPPPAVEGFDPIAIARHYIGLREPQAHDMRAVLQRLRQIQRAMDLLARAGRAPAIVHGDPVHGNLRDGRQLWLLDWDYAQLADPLFDVAAVLAYYPAARVHAATLRQAAALGAGGIDAELEAAITVHRVLGELWHYARGEALPAAT